MASKDKSARHPAEALSGILSVYTKAKNTQNDLKLEIMKQRLKQDQDYAYDIMKQGAKSKMDEAKQKRMADYKSNIELRKKMVQMRSDRSELEDPSAKWKTDVQKQAKSELGISSDDVRRKNQANQLGALMEKERAGVATKEDIYSRKALEFEMYGQVSPDKPVGVTANTGMGGQPQGGRPQQGQPQQGGVDPNEPSPVITYQDGFDKMGQPKMKTLKNPKYDQYLKQQGRRRATADEAQITFDTIAGAGQRVLDYYTLGYDEGGMGGKMREKKSDIALWMGSDVGDRYKYTAAFTGQKGEMALKMMPMLTGSVRIVQSVFAYLMKSIPAENDGPATAREKMKQTVRNMYGIMKASQMRGITPAYIDSLTQEQADALGTKIIAESAGYMDDNDPGLQKMLSRVLGSVDELIEARKSGKYKRGQFVSRYEKGAKKSSQAKSQKSGGFKIISEEQI